MNRWTVIAAAVALAVAGVAVVAAVGRARREPLEEIPEILADCFDRIRQIEAELHRIQAPPPATGAPAAL